MFGSDQSLSIVIKARDEASAIFSRVEENAGKLSSRLQESAAASRTFALGLAAGATAVGGLGYAALKAAGDMEQTTVAFTTMLGSGEKAKDFIAQLVQFAKTTPFTLTGLETAAKQLLAFGFAQKDVLPDLKSLGDIAAGVGMDKLPNLILAFGQVKAATHLTGMELRQFTEAGVPLLDGLSQVLGKSVADIQDMISKGEVGFPVVEQALKNLSGEGGRFNNLMEKQSHTLEGMLSNLQDAWNIFLTGQGQKLLEWAKNFTDAAIFIVQNVLPLWVDRIATLVEFFAKHQVAIYVVAGAIVGALTPAIYAAALAFGALALSLAPFILGGAIVGGLVAGVMWIIQHWDLIKAKASEVWTAVANTIKGAFQAVGDFVMDKVQAVIDAYNRMIATISKPFTFAGNLVSGAAGAVGNFFSGLPHFEQGGTVPGAVGQAVPIIAHGQERVIPAGASTSSGGMTINFNNVSVRNDADIRSLRAEFDSYFRQVLMNRKIAI